MPTVCEYQQSGLPVAGDAVTSSKVSPNRPLHVLTLTPFYPHAGDDAAGFFVAAPLPFFDPSTVKSTVIAIRPLHRKRARAASAHPATWLHYVSVPGNSGLASSGAFLFARMLSRIRALHAAEPVDLIHAHAALPCGHAAALLSRALRIPYVVSVHGRDAYSSQQVGGVSGRWCRRISEMVYRGASRVVCVSDKVRHEVEGGCQSARCTVVYNGVDPEVFRPDPRECDRDLVVLSIGNLIESKGHECLLRAIAEVSSSSLRYEIIGTGPERGRLVSLAEGLGIRSQVQFLGRQPREAVAAVLRRCTIFALPSRYEALGCVYLEAMASGCPVVGCRGQGIDEVIQSGYNGWLVDADNPQQLSEALVTLLNDARLRARMGAAARNTITSGFTLTHQAEHLAQIYWEFAQ